MSNKKNLRPNCEQMMREKKFWALELRRLKQISANELENLKHSVDESFHSTFIKLRLKYEWKTQV